MKTNTRKIDHLPTRREALVGMMAVAAAMGSVASATETPQRSRLGLVAFNCSIRRKWMQQRDPKFDLFEPLTFLKHCRGVGASGMQTSLGVLDVARVKSLRDFADEQKLCIDGMKKKQNTKKTRTGTAFGLVSKCLLCVGSSSGVEGRRIQTPASSSLQPGTLRHKSIC